jgi:hypothetical protein
MELTFKDFDKLGLEPFADKLTTYLITEAKFVSGSYVLSLNSEFGSGKTTFLQMWANKLNATKDAPDVVYVNAWESDFHSDPLPAIICALLDGLQDKKTEERLKAIKETTGKLCRFTLAVGNDMVRKVTGIDFIKAGQYAEPETGEGKAEVGRACFELYRERQRLVVSLRSSLTELASQSENPIFILVDELDRCRPTYAVEFLETVKHLFDIRQLVFVLAVDKRHLASSAKSLFGQQLDFDEYYRKFAHRNVTLPVKSPKASVCLCKALVEEYLREDAFTKKARFSYIQQDGQATENVTELCVAFSLNARQLHEMLRTASHVFSATTKTNSLLPWGFRAATLFMIAISLKNGEVYSAIGQKRIALGEFTSYLKTLPLWKDKTHYAFWWAALLYLGAFGRESPASLEKEFVNLGAWVSTKDDPEAFERELRRFQSAYDRFARDPGGEFAEVYEIMEALRTFAE